MRGDGVGVGDVDEMPRGAWGGGHTAGGDDGWGAISKHIMWLVGGRCEYERDESHESCWHWIDVGDGARVEHGSFAVHVAQPGGAYGMRGDGVGVRDVCAMYDGRAWSGRDAAGGDDGGGSRWERDASVVGGRWRSERGTTREPGGDGIGIDDGTRGQSGDADVYSTGAGGADGMRGDGVGVGDVGEMPCGAWGGGHTACFGDSWRSIGEPDGGMVGGHGSDERDA